MKAAYAPKKAEGAHTRGRYLFCYGVDVGAELSQGHPFVLSHHAWTVKLPEPLVGIGLHMSDSSDKAF